MSLPPPPAWSRPSRSHASRCPAQCTLAPQPLLMLSPPRGGPGAPRRLLLSQQTGNGLRMASARVEAANEALTAELAGLATKHAALLRESRGRGGGAADPAGWAAADHANGTAQRLAAALVAEQVGAGAGRGGGGGDAACGWRFLPACLPAVRLPASK